MDNVTRRKKHSGTFVMLMQNIGKWLAIGAFVRAN